MSDVTRAVRDLALIHGEACKHLGQLAHVIDRNADVMPAGALAGLRNGVANVIYDLGGIKACLRQIDGSAGGDIQSLVAAAE